MEKLRFPIKTKVAAWWTIGLAIIGIGIVIYFIRERESIPYYLLALVFFIFLFLSGFFILKNKKWAWRGGVFLLLAGWIILNLNPIA